MTRPEERDKEAEKVWDTCYGRYLKSPPERHEIEATPDVLRALGMEESNG